MSKSTSNLMENLKFPSGRTVRRLKQDAKTLKREKNITLGQALNIVASENGLDMSWRSALKNLCRKYEAKRHKELSELGSIMVRETREFVMKSRIDDLNILNYLRPFPSSMSVVNQTDYHTFDKHLSTTLGCSVSTTPKSPISRIPKYATSEDVYAVGLIVVTDNGDFYYDPKGYGGSYHSLMEVMGFERVPFDAFMYECLQKGVKISPPKLKYYNVCSSNVNVSSYLELCQNVINHLLSLVGKD
ncbi:hypothetical protein AB6D11_06280 [Vibrio splendidus]